MSRTQRFVAQLQCRSLPVLAVPRRPRQSTISSGYDLIKWSETAKAEPAARTHRELRRVAGPAPPYIVHSRVGSCTSMVCSTTEVYQLPAYSRYRRPQNQAMRPKRHRLPRIDVHDARAQTRFPTLHLCASVDGHQCFPFYTYSPDGVQPLAKTSPTPPSRQFRSHYRQSCHHQVGHLPLHLRRPPPSGLPREVRRQPQARAAPHPLRPRFRRVRRSWLANSPASMSTTKTLNPWPLQFIENPAEPFS